MPQKMCPFWAKRHITVVPSSNLMAISILDFSFFDQIDPIKMGLIKFKPNIPCNRPSKYSPKIPFKGYKIFKKTIKMMNAYLILFLLFFFAFFGKCRADEPEKIVGGVEPEEVLPYRQYVSEQNYHVPFKTRISEPFKEYQTVHAVGKTKPNPKRIDLNFHVGGNDDDDMPLHLSTRFDEGIMAGKVVFNTFVNRNWSVPEERVDSPFRADDEFDIRVRILPGKYQVFGNRQSLGTFDQRIHLFGVNHVSLLGDLSSLRVFHYGGTQFPNPYNAIAKLLPGKRLDISVLPTGNRVNFNLYKQNNQDIALHISIRYNEGTIVRNALTSQNWGAEETEGGFPLAKNELFDLTIINEPANFLIILNGKKFATFAHRSPNYDIETLEVDGTVELHTVTINDAPRIQPGK